MRWVRQVRGVLMRRLGDRRYVVSVSVALIGLVATAAAAIATFSATDHEPESRPSAVATSHSARTNEDPRDALTPTGTPAPAPTPAAAISTPEARNRLDADPATEDAFAERQLIVRFDPEATAADIARTRARFGLRLLRRVPGTGAHLVATETSSVKPLARKLEETSAVLYAEPNFLYRASATTPDDPLFDQLWGLNNTGQTIGSRSGTPDADIDAPEAWDKTTGSVDVVVAVVDTGVASDHPDLAPNIWVNPGESGDGKEANEQDDDGNGYADDHKGRDFVDDDNDPADLNGHGTHVAATIGARGGDGIGVAGVSWRVAIMPLRALDATGAGYSADIAAAFDYAGTNGAHIVNASLGGPSPSQVILDAIARHPETLFVVAAGNSSGDNDVTPTYPCNYAAANVICVAATDQNDGLAAFSNYGATTVDLGAPGKTVLSAVPAFSTPFNDDFEADLSSRWSPGGTGGAWGRAVDEYGYYLADSPDTNYAASEDHWIVAGPFDLSGLSNCRLGYVLRTGTEPTNDRLVVEATSDGTTWSRIAERSGSTDGGWLEMNDDLSAFDGKAGIRLRLRFVSNETIEMAGTDLDDLHIVCTSSSYSGDEYANFSGTSMAAPHVAGSAALLRSVAPSMPLADVKKAILEGVDPLPALQGKTVTGGRLNAATLLGIERSPSSGETTGDAGTDSPVATTARDHQRSVTLDLRRHLIARGRVTVADGYNACRSRVLVVIRRNGVAIARTRTNTDGFFRVRIGDRRGRYLARAVRVEIGEGPDRCLRDDSPLRRHRH